MVYQVDTLDKRAIHILSGARQEEFSAPLGGHKAETEWIVSGISYLFFFWEWLNIGDKLQKMKPRIRGEYFHLKQARILVIRLLLICREKGEVDRSRNLIFQNSVSLAFYAAVVHGWRQRR